MHGLMLQLELRMQLALRRKNFLTARKTKGIRTCDARAMPVRYLVKLAPGHSAVHRPAAISSQVLAFTHTAQTSCGLPQFESHEKPEDLSLQPLNLSQADLQSLLPPQPARVLLATIMKMNRARTMLMMDPPLMNALQSITYQAPIRHPSSTHQQR